MQTSEIVLKRTIESKTFCLGHKRVRALLKRTRTIMIFEREQSTLWYVCYFLCQEKIEKLVHASSEILYRYKNRKILISQHTFFIYYSTIKHINTGNSNSNRLIII